MPAAGAGTLPRLGLAAPAALGRTSGSTFRSLPHETLGPGQVPHSLLPVEGCDRLVGHPPRHRAGCHRPSLREIHPLHSLRPIQGVPHSGSPRQRLGTAQEVHGHPPVPGNPNVDPGPFSRGHLRISVPPVLLLLRVKLVPVHRRRLPKALVLVPRLSGRWGVPPMVLGQLLLLVGEQRREAPLPSVAHRHRYQHREERAPRERRDGDRVLRGGPRQNRPPA
jgi:hypothetical protein